MENIKELRELGANVELNSDKLLTLNGDWSDIYNEYHEHFSIIKGSLYTSKVHHKDFLKNLTSLGTLDTYDSIQHKDFLSNLTVLETLHTYNVIQHKDFLSNLNSLGSLITYGVQHKDFLKNLTSLGRLYTYNVEQHKDFLKNLTSLGYLYTYNSVQHKDFLKNLTSLGYLDSTYSVQHPDFLSNLKVLGDLYTSNSVQHKDFLKNLNSLGRLNTYVEQHKDFLKNVSNEFDLPYLYLDNILSIVESTKQLDNALTVYKTKRVGYEDIEYIVSDGEFHSHGSSIKMALLDLRFKQSERDTDWLKDKNINDILSFEDSVLAYRLITGSCMSGIEYFLKTIDEKDEYKISDIIDLTVGQYGSEEFKNFFVKN